MGRSIDLYSYDYEKLKNKILVFCKTNDVELIEKILSTCGNKIEDRYVLLNQEMWEGCSCYYNVSTVLEKIFKIDDVFGNIFCATDDSELDRKTLISAIEMYEVVDILGLNNEDFEEEYE